MTLHPTPDTLEPARYTLHQTPVLYTLHPTPEPLKPLDILAQITELLEGGSSRAAGWRGGGEVDWGAGGAGGAGGGGPVVGVEGELDDGQGGGLKARRQLQRMASFQVVTTFVPEGNYLDINVLVALA